MKNKVILICVILAALLSLMTFVAVLAQKTGDVKEPEESQKTEDTTVKEEEEVILRELTISDSSLGESGNITIIYEEGMTWEEWIESKYNLCGVFYDESVDKICSQNSTYLVNDFLLSEIKCDDIIQSDIEYVFS